MPLKILLCDLQCYKITDIILLKIKKDFEKYIMYISLVMDLTQAESIKHQA